MRWSMVAGIVAAGLLSGGFSEAAESAPARQSALVIRNVSVIPMTDAVGPFPDHAVVIDGGRIVWVGPEAELNAPSGSVERDGHGGFLLPGLADMHAHVTEAQLPLYLANGVTTVRELNGSREHLELRSRIAQGSVVGPRLLVSSPLLTEGEWPVRHIEVPDPDSAIALASQLIEAGYDYLKLYDGLSQGAYDALVAAARRADIPFTGHIPEAVGLQGVLDAGQHLEHVEKIAWATVGHDPDPSRIPEVVEAIRDAGVWVTPTLYSMRVLMNQGTVYFESLFERPEMEVVNPELLSWWSSLRRPGTAREVDPESTPARIHAFQRELTRQLFLAGVPLLVGTDAPNPLVIPGFGIHDEIETLIDAGLPTHAVLRMATAAAAEHVGRSGEWGVVAPGAAADLVLVERNPLTDPGTLREPVAVLVNGRWLEGGEA